MKHYSIALDASSSHIGWALMEGRHARFSGTKELTGPIEQRCLEAQEFLRGLIKTWPKATHLAIEAPAGRFKKGLIPQCRVSGALLAQAAKRKLTVVEITPTEGKKALTGDGSASKADMILAATGLKGCKEGLVFQTGKRFGKPARAGDVRAWTFDGHLVMEEHEADAIGVGLAAAGKI